MKKVCSIFMALLLCVGVIGCESNNSNGKLETENKEKIKNEKFIDKAIEVFDKNMTIHEKKGKGVAIFVSRDGDTLKVLPQYEFETRDEIQLINDGYYKFNDFANEFVKYENSKKEGTKVTGISYDIDEKIDPDSYYEYSLKDKVYGNPIEEQVNFTEKYEQYFDCTIKEQGSNKVLIFECTDIKGFSKKYYEDLKKEDPTFEPLEFDGIKISKREFAEYKAEFIFDKEYNLLTTNHIINYDYGNGLVAKNDNTVQYSRLTAPTYTISEIEEYFKKGNK